MFKRSTSKSNWNLEVLVFREGGKLEDSEKNTRIKVRNNNKLNPHETASTRIEHGSKRWNWGERIFTATLMLSLLSTNHSKTSFTDENSTIYSQ